MSTIRKEHSLTGRIDPALRLPAFQKVQRNRGAAGIDRVRLQMFQNNLQANLTALQRDLKRGTFRPQPSRRRFIEKPGSDKLRPLGIPAVRDRIAQAVVRRLLSPIFEPLFHDHSYGFRPGRNCHQAVKTALELHRAGYQVVLDPDIESFFDRLPHSVIRQAVAARVADGNILRWVQKFLTAGVMENGVFKPTSVGTPQGGVISPLLSNIVLNHLDWPLHEAGFRFVRYADDFVVLCRSHAEAEEARARTEQVLGGLGLKLSAEKTTVTTYGQGYSFLGFRLSSRSRTLRPKSVQKFKDKIRSLTRRQHNLDAGVIEKLNRVIRGTANYFATPFATCRWLFQRLDSWIRMRLRCMRFKRQSGHDNCKLRVRFFRRKLGLLTLEEFLTGMPRYVKSTP